VVKVQDKDKAVAAAWDKAAVAGKEADEVWAVEVDVVWGAEAALLVPVASVSVPIAVRPFHISKACLALNKTVQSAAGR
jgi:hypothetical protein